MTTITDITTEQVAEAIGVPVERWAHECHSISLAIVKAGVLGVPARVARGWSTGVSSQHSWVVYSAPGDEGLPDCYADDALICDPTRWSYIGGDPHLEWTTAADGTHNPHGEGSIWVWGQPRSSGGDPLMPAAPFGGWSPMAQAFLGLLEPLDLDGWIALLSNAPVGGWPAAEIIGACADDPSLAPYIPIDRLGMLTDRNPKGLYLA